MMNSLRPSLFRPAARPTPSSPIPTPPPPDESHPADKTSRKALLAGFKKPSPNRSMSLSQVPTTIQDGSYLQVLSLKLSEGVSKALAQPACHATAGECLSGRRPIPAGRGREFGSLIAV